MGEEKEIVHINQIIWCTKYDLLIQIISRYYGLLYLGILIHEYVIGRMQIYICITTHNNHMNEIFEIVIDVTGHENDNFWNCSFNIIIIFDVVWWSRMEWEQNQTKNLMRYNETYKHPFYMEGTFDIQVLYGRYL
jgi:hypothetical protein